MKRWVVLGLLCFFVLSMVGTGMAADRGYANPQMLISAEELKAKLDAGQEISIVAVDKGATYMLGHIPGAVGVWGGEMTNPDHAVSGMVATPEAFAKLMGEKGISNDSYVVVYDSSGGLWATRLIWMMQMYGHHKVQLLDGGMEAWKSAGGDVEHFAPKVEAATYEVKSIDYRMTISTDDVAAKLDDSNFVMIDARSEGEYTGEKKLGGAGRAGHIPGAVHIEWNKTLNADGTLKSAAELKELYASYGVTPDKEIAAHCHSAVRSAHTIFVLRLIGYPNVRNYDPSWLGWSNREDLPVE